MERYLLNKIAGYRYGLPLFVVFSGLLYGAFISLLFLRMKPTYATFIIAGTITPILMMVLGSSKKFLWIILLILLPVTVDFTIHPSDHLGGATGWVISAFDLLLGALYLIWIAEMIQKRHIAINFFSEISIPALCLIGSACLSAFFARKPMLSIYEMVEVVKMYLAFLYMANNVRNKKDLKFIVFIFLFCITYEGFLGFAQHHWGEPFFPRSLGGPTRLESRVCGTWQSFNDFSWYLTFFLPLCLSLLFSDYDYKNKILCFMGLGAGSAALIWTNSRAGWISFTFVSIIITLVCLNKVKGKKKLFNILGISILLLVLAMPLYPRLISKVDERLTGDDRGSADSRWPQFKMALSIMGDNLIAGAGLNNYTEIMFDYDNTDEGILSLTPFQVHNFLLQIGAEMGLLGVISFFWLIASIFIKGIKLIFRQNDYEMFVVLGLLAGITAFILHGMFDALSLGGKLFCFNWVFIGIITGVDAYTKKS